METSSSLPTTTHLSIVNLLGKWLLEGGGRGGGLLFEIVVRKSGQRESEQNQNTEKISFEGCFRVAIVV